MAQSLNAVNLAEFSSIDTHPDCAFRYLQHALLCKDDTCLVIEFFELLSRSTVACTCGTENAFTAPDCNGAKRKMYFDFCNFQCVHGVTGLGGP
jgi:hypothetical protein